MPKELSSFVLTMYNKLLDARKAVPVLTNTTDVPDRKAVLDSFITETVEDDQESYPD